MSRSEYCCVNEIDDTRKLLESYSNETGLSLDRLEQKIKSLAGIVSDDDYDSLMEEIDGLRETKANVDVELTDLDDWVEEFDQFAHDQLEIARHQGKEDAESEYDDRLNAVLVDANKHYEQLVHDIVYDEFLIGLDGVEQHLVTKRIDEQLRCGEFVY